MNAIHLHLIINTIKMPEPRVLSDVDGCSDGIQEVPAPHSKSSLSPQAHQQFDQQFPKNRVVYSSQTGEVYCERPFPAISKISYQNGKFSVSVGMTPEFENDRDDWNAYAHALGRKVQLISSLNTVLLQCGFNFSSEKMNEFLAIFQKDISLNDLALVLRDLCDVLRRYTRDFQDSSSYKQPNLSLPPNGLRGDEGLEELESLLSLRQRAALDRFEYLLARRGYFSKEPDLRGHSFVGNYTCAPDNSDQERQIYIGFFGTGDLEHLKKMATGELESVPEVKLSIWDRSSGYSLYKEGLSHREVFPGKTPPTLADIETLFSGSELDDKFAWAILKPRIVGGQNLPAIFSSTDVAIPQMT